MRTLIILLGLAAALPAQSVVYAGRPCVVSPTSPAIGLSHTGVPRIGTTLTFQAAPTLTGTWMYWIGLSDQTCHGILLPWSGQITLGCPVYVCPLVTLPTDNPGTLPLAIPNDGSLIGLTLYLQASKLQFRPPLVNDYFTTNYATVVVG